jgi:tetratricopeptide (TPR) repeat protein
MDIEDDILIQKYEMLLYNKASMYFDMDEFETIIIYYMSEERFADALEALIHAELCHPDDTELALHRVRIMMNLENYDKAFELLVDLEDKMDDLFEISLYKGHIYAMNDDIENAVAAFKLAVERSPGPGCEIVHDIPEILIEMNYFDEALIFLHKFIDSGDTNAKIFFNAGFCYEQLSKFDESEKYYEKSLDENPFDEKTWIMLGAMYLGSGNFDKALEAFEFALSINNNATIALLCKTATLIQSGDYSNAIENITKIMSHNSDDAGFLCTLGEYYEKKQDFEKAEQIYMEIIGQKNDSDMSYWGLSKLLYAQGDIENAIQVIDKAIEIDPDNEEYLYFRGQCFISLSKDKNMLSDILQSMYIIKETNAEKIEDAEFMNKYKKAVFFYNVGIMEDCCKYLLESLLINSEGLEMFFNLFPKAKDNAYLINYLGKYLK